MVNHGITGSEIMIFILSFFFQPSQVVWTVPLIGSLGTPVNGYAVHIDPTKCLIGDEEGKSKLLCD